MFKLLLKIRYVTVVIVILAALHALAFLVIGARIGLGAYWQVLHPASDEAGRPGLHLLHSLDFLFVSMALVVLALGIAKLFLVDSKAIEEVTLPGWLKIESITELKVLLWETILTTLLVIALSDLSKGLFTSLEWTVLLTPAAILMLALSLYFMKRR